MRIIFALKQWTRGTPFPAWQERPTIRVILNSELWVNAWDENLNSLYHLYV